MRIVRLHLDRYGIFTDRTLTFDPEAALHIVLGANEAGKTSALSAIGDFIFGFGGRTAYDFKHDSKFLRIGECLRHSHGRTVTARRRKGHKNTLIGNNDEALPDDLFAPFTTGISRFSARVRSDCGRVAQWGARTARCGRETCRNPRSQFGRLSGETVAVER